MYKKNLFQKSLIFISFALVTILICGIFYAGGMLVLNKVDKSKISSQVKSPATKDDLKATVLKFDKLEKAITAEEKAVGLMNRNSLCDNCGMIFIFPKEKVQEFWMKNTFISLDIIFINENGKIVKIHQNTKTNQTNELYNSILPAKYTIETNAGWSLKNGISTGDLIDIKSLI